MDQSLRDAAQQGNVSALYRSIGRDADVLDRIEKIPFVETPLHRAAAAGQTKFAMEVLRLNRSFCKKLNPDGYSPMHLALQNGHAEIVNHLLDFDENLVRVQGRNGWTPLHFAAQTGNPELLFEMLKACPWSIEDVTNEKETVFHIALKFDKLEAFQFLLGWLRRAWFRQAYAWEKKLLNCQDEEGNTLLHIAVAKKLPQMVQLLLDFKSFFRCIIDTNAKNSMGATAVDMLQGQRRDADHERIKNFLYRVRRSNTLQPQSLSCPTDYFKSPMKWDEKLYLFFLRQTMSIPPDTRNVLLVVAALLVTVTFQVTVSPPGGVWQDNSPSGNDTAQATIQNSFNGGNSSPTSPHAVGTATMEKTAFIILSVLNGISFFFSALSILLLLPNDFGTGMFGLPMVILSVSFLASVIITTPVGVFGFPLLGNHYASFFILSPLVFLGVVGFVHWTRRNIFQAFLPIRE